VSCYGGNNGSASSIVSGGATPYTYSWSGGGSNSTVSGLTAGTYTLTLHDNNGCSATASATITQPAIFTASANITANVMCNGENGGSASSTIIGGITPYTYSWSGGGTLSNISGLTAGTYTLIVHDNSGCSTTATTTITQPNVLSVTPNAGNNISCHGGNNGSASSIVNGGTTPYTYSWSGGGTLSNVSGLTAGTYTLSVTDKNSCTGSATVTITQPATTLSLSANPTANPNCHGAYNGSASATASGGISPYTYNWLPSGGNNPTTSDLSAGTYTITVTDAGGCSSSVTTAITQPTAIIITANTVDMNSSGACNGQASVSITGGLAPYTYSWSPGGGTTDTINGKCAGDYCCTITDNNGCSETSCVSIINVTGIAAINNSSDNINIYPDPNNGSFTMTGIIHGHVIELYNYIGQKLSNTIVDNTTMHFNISNQPNGIYLYRVLSENGDLVGQGKLIIQK
jgi:hypothetical protein